MSSTPARPPLWVTLIATALGAGFMPRMPGHSGTLVGVGLAYLLSRLGAAWFYGATVLVILVGTYVAERYVAITLRTDDQRIVIDEVAGYLLTLGLCPRAVLDLLAGFFLFRLLDVWKPGLIGRCDRSLSGGVGVMADDLLAGLFGAPVLYGLNQISAWRALAATIEAWVHK